MIENFNTYTINIVKYMNNNNHKTTHLFYNQFKIMSLIK